MQQYPQNFVPQAGQQFQSGAQRPQEIRFYKASIFWFASVAGKFERDLPNMRAQGWHVKEMMVLGLNKWLRMVLAVVYER